MVVIGSINHRFEMSGNHTAVNPQAHQKLSTHTDRNANKPDGHTHTTLNLPFSLAPVHLNGPAPVPQKHLTYFHSLLLGIRVETYHINRGIRPDRVPPIITMNLHERALTLADFNAILR